MKVCMKINISGHRDGKPWPQAGEEFVVPDAEGVDLCSQGYAEPVADVKPEKATPRKAAEKRG